MVCSFYRILRAVSSLLKIYFFAFVVTWELLGNIHSEELEGYIASRVQTKHAVCWGAEVTHWLVRLKLLGLVAGSITS